jgi:hypothetical protein
MAISDKNSVNFASIIEERTLSRLWRLRVERAHSILMSKVNFWESDWGLDLSILEELKDNNLDVVPTAFDQKSFNISCYLFLRSDSPRRASL